MNAQPEVALHALQRFSPDPDSVYSIDMAAHLAGLPRHDVLVCCKQGLVSPRVDPEFGGFYFDEPTLRTLRQIAYLRVDCGINFAGIRIILGLMEEVERLQAVVRAA